MKQYYRHNHAHPQTLLEEVQCEYTIGIPKGRFSSVPGLGIQTLLVDFAFWDNLNLATSLSLWAGVRDFTPSTPAVLFPRLSCETRRTARHLAAQDLINVFWSLRTALLSPRLEAL